MYHFLRSANYILLIVSWLAFSGVMASKEPIVDTRFLGATHQESPSAVAAETDGIHYDFDNPRNTHSHSHTLVSLLQTRAGLHTHRQTDRQTDKTDRQKDRRKKHR